MEYSLARIRQLQMLVDSKMIYNNFSADDADPFQEIKMSGIGQEDLDEFFDVKLVH